jgi:hypothetical protein
MYSIETRRDLPQQLALQNARALKKTSIVSRSWRAVANLLRRRLRCINHRASASAAGGLAFERYPRAQHRCISGRVARAANCLSNSRTLKGIHRNRLTMQQSSDMEVWLQSDIHGRSAGIWRNLLRMATPDPIFETPNVKCLGRVAERKEHRLAVCAASGVLLR